jgi:Trm5-related predicted tRNA methylase
MAKAIITQRASNDEMARLTDELLDEVRAIVQSEFDAAEESSGWMTVTVELQFEAGKLKTLRHLTNRTKKPADRQARNGELLTKGHRSA